MNKNSGSVVSDWRVEQIMKTLGESNKELTTVELAKSYVTVPSESDKLTSGTICNVLAAVGLIEKSSRPVTLFRNVTLYKLSERGRAYYVEVYK